jgi:LPS export ABC transporter protein LptC
MAAPVYIRPLLVFLVAVAIFGIAAVVLKNGSHDTPPPQSVGQQLPRNSDVELQKARFSEIQDGAVVWELATERVEYDKNLDMAYLTGITMEFQRRHSQGAVTVTADSGEYASSLKVVRLKGRVIVTTENGARFTSDSIVYTGATDQFTTSDPVTFRQQRLQLTAVGMDWGVKNQRARFLSAVEASIVLQ